MSLIRNLGIIRRVVGRTVDLQRNTYQRGRKRMLGDTHELSRGLGGS